MGKGFLEHRYAATQQEVAERFGISKQRVDQIEKSAIRKLRAELIWQAKKNGMTVEEWLFGTMQPDDTQIAFQEFDRTIQECAA